VRGGNVIVIQDHYVWFVWSGMFLIPWIILYLAFARYRKIMLWSSVLTAPFGLTEPLFVPKYWNPPSLFDLAQRTGFDIESLIFTFALGGVAAVLYNAITRRAFVAFGEHRETHRHHRLAIVTPILVFPILVFLPWNPIYPGIAAMFLGAIAAVLCRPDLTAKTFFGGALFTVYYVIFLQGLELLSPGYIARFWNLPALSGVVVALMPLEELLFAFTLGMYWTNVYEHLTWTTAMRTTAGAVEHSELGGELADHRM
jgi:Lycopene cyclase